MGRISVVVGYCFLNVHLFQVVDDVIDLFYKLLDFFCLLILMIPERYMFLSTSKIEDWSVSPLSSRDFCFISSEASICIYV